MKRLFVILGILLCSKEVIAYSLSDFLYLGSATQTIGTVTSIIDGDTIKVELPTTETKVRLLSINTPEVPDEPFAQEAKTFTFQLLNQPVKLYYSASATLQYDTYGRLLAVVVKDDEIFNLKLLEKGLAVRMFIFNDIIKFSAWEDVEINARQQKLKIWSNINSQGIFLTEINPNPAPESDNEAEFVELYNNNSTAVNVGSWTFVSIYNEAVIPAGTIIPNNGYLIIARTNPTRFKEIYPNTPQETIIINAGDNLRLQNNYTPKENLVIYLKAQDKSYQEALTYDLDWDNAGANGTGRTLERKSLSKINVGDSEIGGADDTNWDVSSKLKGTPGTSNLVSRLSLDVPKWIISCQRSTGAICTNQSQTQIIPYKANIAALGLLTKSGYEDEVRAWIDWYFAHLESYGTIYDYEVVNGTETSLYSARSEDRNISTFFTLLKKYYQITFNIDYLKKYQTILDTMGIYLLFSLQDGNDYLTWTDSNYQDKLLINNTESYQGLKDLASVYFDLFDNDSQRDFYDGNGNFVKVAIDTELWKNDSYYWEKDGSGNKTSCDWTTLYPDSIAQLYTILNNVNLPESTRSNTLYNTFNTNQPLWTGTISYCEMGYAAGLMADTTRTQTYQNSIINNVINKDYPPPWDIQEAGFYLLIEDRINEVNTIQPLINQPKELGLNFIESKMLTPFGGIQAQFDNNTPINNTDGVNHEVTSEATGQALLYAALTNNKFFFDEQFTLLKDKMLSSTYNVLAWKLKPNGEWWDNNGQYANAAIDDLRVIRALLLAYDRWGGNYLNEAKALSQGLKAHNIQNGELRNYFTWEPAWTSQEVFLSYLDLCTLKRLSEFDSDFESILQTNKRIILGGTTTSGLYYFRYISGNYYGQDNGSISMIHAGWIAENLARYWKQTGDQECRASAEKFLNFARNEYNTYGKIFGKYDILTGTHTVEYEDTAIYSIIARLAFILGDFDFAETLLNNKILSQQNKNIRSRTIGCFGYDFGNPYAFVCLESLLGMVELEAKKEYLIRGRCVTSDKKPIAGVLLNLTGTTQGTVCTDSSGKYEFSGTPGGSYTITPSKVGYNFIPNTIQFNPLNQHWDNVEFSGVSGKITVVSPLSGTVGTLITVKGEGFSVREDIRISFGGIITLVIITSDNVGEFTTIFTTPLQPSGTMTIIAYGGISNMMGNGYFFLRALDHFKIATTSSQIAGEGFVISIYAFDARGNIFEYAGTTSIRDTSMSILPVETTPFSSGIWTGTVTITKAGTTTISVFADKFISGTSNTFFVTPGQLSHFTFGTITSQIAGNPFPIKITSLDRYGNMAAYSGIAYLKTETTTTITFTQGIWEGTVTLTTASTTTISVFTDPFISGTSNPFLVLPNTLDHFVIGTITNQIAGIDFYLTITAKDKFENIVDGFTGTATLTNALITFKKGIWEGTVTITKAGTTTISVFTDPFISGTSNPFLVLPNTLDHFVIGTITNQIAGIDFYLVITAKDKFKNIVDGFTGTATLTNTLITFKEGIWKGTVTITKAGTTAISVFTDPFISGTSNTFFVAPGQLSYFTFGTITSQIAGNPFPVKITSLDRYGNMAAYSGTAYLKTETTTTITFTQGIWEGTVTLTKAGTTTISVFTDQFISGTSNSFWVAARQLDHFTFATITNQVAGIGFKINIVAKDIYENIAGYSGIAYLQDTSQTILPTKTSSFINGIWEGTVTITTAGTTTISVFTDQFISKTSNIFYVSPDVLNKIMITPARIELSVGSEYRFLATGYDKYGNELEGLTYFWETIIGSVNPTSGTQTLFMATTTLTTGTLTARWGTIIGYATITLQIGVLKYLIISPTNATITVGNSMIFTAKGYDNYGNERFIEGGLWETNSGSVIPNVGTKTQFTASTKTGQGWIKYQLNQIIGLASISISAGSHTGFRIGAISSPQTAGIPFYITITAQDTYSNTVENYTGSVILNSSAGNISPDRTTNFTSGSWFGTITLEKTSDMAIITVQDSNIKGTSNAFTIYSNTLDFFNISNIAPTYLINSEIPIVIVAKDRYGNTVTNYNGAFSLTDDTQTIYPEVATCTSGEFRGSVSISKAKPQIKITAKVGDKQGVSNLFTTLIDNEQNSKVTDGETSIEIPKGNLPADFYMIIDSDPDKQKTEINLANASLSLNKTSLAITNSLHLFQAYDKDNQPLQIGTNSFILISLPYPDEDEDEIVDYPDVVVKERTLKIYELRNYQWREVQSSTVHPYKNVVSASVPRFGVYMLVGQIIPVTFEDVVVYPNPFKPIRGDSEIIFDGLPQNTTIRIYDISGNLIKEIEGITVGSYKWDVQDNYGRNVSSGIYVYIINNDKGKKIGKIAIIR